MVQHVYHAAVGEQEFTAEVNIPDPEDQQSFASAMRGFIDETHSSIFGQISKPLHCQHCGKNAVTVLHHPMLFAHADPPRVEDILSPVCAAGSCARKAKDEIEMALAKEHALSGLADRVGDVVSACENCSKTGSADAPLRQCSRCKVAKYCSETCQRAHWAAHKVVCKK
jgi:hypothetical protein